MEYLQLLQNLKKNPMTPANYHRLIAIIEHLALEIISLRSTVGIIKNKGIDE